MKGEKKMLVAAQCIMVLTLLLMISGKTPLYTTAIVGSAISTHVYRCHAGKWLFGCYNSQHSKTW